MFSVGSTTGQFEWYTAGNNTSGAGAAATLTQAMTLDASGNLGVGTTSPGSYLSGTAKLVAYANANSQNNILVRNDSSGASSSSAIALNASGNTWGIEIGSSAKNGNALTFQLDYGGTNSEKMRLDSSGNLGLGVTPSAWGSSWKSLQLPNGAALSNISGLNALYLSENAVFANDQSSKYIASDFATLYQQYNGQHRWFNAPSGTAGNAITFTQAMTLDSSGNLLVGTTTQQYASTVTAKQSTAANGVFSAWNASTSGDAQFIWFGTEAGGTTRGTITYNRAGGLVAYNTTSDYRAKTVNGPVQNALSKITALKPYTGRMNDATLDIDFFVAHELQDIVPSAVIGEKDAIKEDGTPEYQMVDKSALIPLLTAAIQELKAEFDAYKATHP